MTKNGLLKTLLITYLLITNTNSFGQELPPRTIFNDYFDAIYNKDSILNIKTLRTTYVADTDKMSIKLEADLKSPNLKLIQAIAEGQVFSKLSFDGEKAIQTTPYGTVSIQGVELSNLKQTSSPFPELDFQETAINKGLTQLEDLTEVYKIQMSEFTFSFYDKQTHLKLQTETQKIVNGNKNKQLIKYQDYRAYQGILIPNTLVISSGNNQLTYRLESVNINTEIPTSEFN
ncbi:MAG: hypothetical protein ACPGRE_02705 [Flavobacteriaceae bacterium]